MAVVLAIVGWLVWAYLAVLTARMVLSLIPLLVRQWEPRGVLLVVSEFVYTVTDPPLRFLRRWIPSPRLGDVMIDLPFLLLFLALWMLLRWLPAGMS